MKNKKGFTLVELLAVIVILAVIILIAVNAVLPQMQKARKKSFADEALSFAKAAENAYVDQQASGTKTFFVNKEEITAADETACTTAGGTWADSKCTKKGLTGEYVTKTDSNYKGCVRVAADASGNITGKEVWLANDKWMIIAKDTDEIGEKLEKIVEVYETGTNKWNTDYNTCQSLD